MTLRSFTNTAAGQTRAPWIVLILGGWAYIGSIVIPQLPFGQQLRPEYLAFWILGVSCGVIKFLDRRPLAALGLQWNAFSSRQTWNGLALGCAMLTMATLAAFAFGCARLSLPNIGFLASIPMFMIEIVTFVLWAAVEEML